MTGGDLAALRLLLDQAHGFAWEPCVAGEYMDGDGETVWLSDNDGDQLAVGKHDVAGMLNALLAIEHAILDVTDVLSVSKR